MGRSNVYSWPPCWIPPPGWALAALSPDLTVVTKSLNTRFLKPATVGPITAQARVVERTERDMIVQAELIDTEGRIVADATARLRILARDRVMQPRR
nr:PaaI family thioesterase [Bradyrhizobium hipponense]